MDGEELEYSAGPFMEFVESFFASMRLCLHQPSDQEKPGPSGLGAKESRLCMHCKEQPLLGYYAKLQELKVSYAELSKILEEYWRLRRQKKHPGLLSAQVIVCKSDAITRSIALLTMQSVFGIGAGELKLALTKGIADLESNMK